MQLHVLEGFFPGDNSRCIQRVSKKIFPAVEGKSGSILFYPLKTKKTTIFCYNFN